VIRKMRAWRESSGHAQRAHALKLLWAFAHTLRANFIVAPPIDVRQWARISRGYAVIQRLGQLLPIIARFAARYGITLVGPAEPWTSKSCSACYELHPALGANKVFACPNELCGFSTSRDLGNAVTNILVMSALTNGALARAGMASRDPEAAREGSPARARMLAAFSAIGLTQEGT